MKRKTMIVPAVFLLVLCLAFAAAEEVSGFTGKWVTVALTSLDSPEWNLPIPAQWNAEMPALEMAEDGTARWIVGLAPGHPGRKPGRFCCRCPAMLRSPLC